MSYHGHCYLYILPSAYDDLLKLGFSRDPLARIEQFHARWFETFDLNRGFLVETESVRDARDLELVFRRTLVEHNAPMPLTVREAAGGATEWYRGAYATLAAAGDDLVARGFIRHAPVREWLRAALLARSDRVFGWAEAVHAAWCDGLATPATLQGLRDVLDAHAALGIEPAALLPERVARWYVGE